MRRGGKRRERQGEGDEDKVTGMLRRERGSRQRG